MIQMSYGVCMSVVFLIYVEELPYADMQNYPLIDQVMAMCGYQLRLIDRTGMLPADPNVFDSLDEAWESSDFAGYRWVYLDAAGSTYVDTYKHPKDNVVYVVGSDAVSPDSFEGKKLKDLNGTVIKLRTASGHESYRSHAVAVATAITRYSLESKARRS